MADITKCSNEKCPLKEKCKRHTAPSGTMQSMQGFKFRRIGSQTVCDFYWYNGI